MADNPPQYTAVPSGLDDTPQQQDNDGIQQVDNQQMTPNPPQQIPPAGDYKPQQMPPIGDPPKAFTAAPGAVHPFPKKSEQGYPARQTAAEYPHGLQPLNYTAAPGVFPQRTDMYTYQPLAPQQQSTNNVMVVNTQPSALAIDRGPKPRDYMILSFLTCFFCCWIFGVIALMYSNRVNASWSVGDVDGARENSRTALQWNIAAIVGGIIILGINIGAVILCRSTDTCGYSNES